MEALRLLALWHMLTFSPVDVPQPVLRHDRPRGGEHRLGHECLRGRVGARGRVCLSLCA
jgi:hypothetical protein